MNAERETNLHTQLHLSVALTCIDSWSTEPHRFRHASLRTIYIMLYWLVVCSVCERTFVCDNFLSLHSSIFNCCTTRMSLVLRWERLLQPHSAGSSTFTSTSARVSASCTLFCHYSILEDMDLKHASTIHTIPQQFLPFPAKSDMPNSFAVPHQT